MLITERIRNILEEQNEKNYNFHNFELFWKQLVLRSEQKYNDRESKEPTKQTEGGEDVFVEFEFRSFRSQTEFQAGEIDLSKDFFYDYSIFKQVKQENYQKRLDRIYYFNPEIDFDLYLIESRFFTHCIQTLSDDVFFDKLNQQNPLSIKDSSFINYFIFINILFVCLALLFSNLYNFRILFWISTTFLIFIPLEHLLLYLEQTFSINSYQNVFLFSPLAIISLVILFNRNVSFNSFKINISFFIVGLLCLGIYGLFHLLSFNTLNWNEIDLFISSNYFSRNIFLCIMLGIILFGMYQFWNNSERLPSQK